MAHRAHEIFDDDGKTIWKYGERYVVLVEWKPKGRKEYVEWQFKQNEVSEDVAKLAWLLDDHESFFEQCAPPNVTQADVTAVHDIMVHVLAALKGDREALDDLGFMAARLDEWPKGERRKAYFVDEVKDRAIEIKAAAEDRQDKLIKQLIAQLVGLYSSAFKTLDIAMVKDAVMSIDPHSTGGRGKKGPPWLAARLIVMANAHEDFDLNRRRSSQTEAIYFKYVLQALQNACRPDRGKSMSSAKKPKTSTKKP